MGRSSWGSRGAVLGVTLRAVAAGLAAAELGGAIAASPAIAQGRIFIRGESHLFAIGPRS